MLRYLSGLDAIENPGIYKKYMYSDWIACTGRKEQVLCRFRFWGFHLLIWNLAILHLSQSQVPWYSVWYWITSSYISITVELHRIKATGTLYPIRRESYAIYRQEFQTKTKAVNPATHTTIDHNRFVLLFSLYCLELTPLNSATSLSAGPHKFFCLW